MDAHALPWPQSANSPELRQRAANAKVLCVGAGGIGCELLKTLALSGFRNIEVIDLDTIETSNLNRQFLFRAWHVGSSKAAVAAEAVRCFAPEASIKPHQGNVKEAAYGVSFFAGFDMVLNGLDNMEARRHVNRLTLAAGTPLVESGTEGYLGQVTPHIKGQTECYECRPKPVPKSFPICTIRNTPDKPIHCVVWAKELLFPRLFGRPEDVTDLDEQVQGGQGTSAIATPVADGSGVPLPDPDPVAAEQQAAPTGVTVDASAEAAAAAEEQAAADKSFFLRHDNEDSGAYARRIFKRVFFDDIDRVSRMEDLWKSRTAPTPLNLEALVPPNGTNGTDSSAAEGPQSSASAALGLSDPHKLLSIELLARLFLKATTTYLDHRSSEVGSAVFDKEDDLAVDFVAAAANLRAACYNIPIQSVFDIKGMAGNIVHAVATTNALISGLITLEALKLLAGASHAAKNTMVLQHVSASRLVYPTSVDPPNERCAVCGTAQLHLSINTANTSLFAFIDKVLKKRLALVSPTISCGSFIYEEGPDLDPEEAAESAAHWPTMLQSLPGGGIRDGAIVDVSDQAQAFEVQIIVAHRDIWDEEEHPEEYLLTGAVPTATANVPGEENGGMKSSLNGDNDASDSDSGFEMLPPVSVSELSDTAVQHPATAANPAKRKREASSGVAGQSAKKQQLEGHRDADMEAAAAAAEEVSREVGASVELADGIGAPLTAPDDDDVVVLDE